eukprot:GHVL01023643.1.p2 GENE.GHVL01023643.1~~GHVL01023643.1.p2  ORF type:complete len:108 (+),score=19.30 GHVL01023643.1:43-366(+)
MLKFFFYVNCFQRRSFCLYSRQKAILYRSGQRGWLELDEILGNFAKRYVYDLNEDEIVEFEKILNYENPDMFKWLSGQHPPPYELVENKIFNKLQDYIINGEVIKKE